MNKWYEYTEEDNIVISSRVRLARNLDGYQFAGNIRDKGCAALVQPVRNQAPRLQGNKCV